MYEKRSRLVVTAPSFADALDLAALQEQRKRAMRMGLSPRDGAASARELIGKVLPKALNPSGEAVRSLLVEENS